MLMWCSRSQLDLCKDSAVFLSFCRCGEGAQDEEEARSSGPPITRAAVPQDISRRDLRTHLTIWMAHHPSAVPASKAAHQLA